MSAISSATNEGASTYEGLYALLDISDWADIQAGHRSRPARFPDGPVGTLWASACALRSVVAF
jgi:hypothetical protein